MEGEREPEAKALASGQELMAEPVWPAAEAGQAGPSSLPPAESLGSTLTPSRTATHTYRKVNLEVVVSTRPLPQVLSSRCHLPSRYTAFQA